MRRTRRLRTATLAVAGLVAAIAVTAVGGSAAARGADPIELKPDIVKAKGFGGFKGDVRKIPHWGKVDAEGAGDQPGGKEPKEDRAKGRAAADPAFQGSGTSSSAPTPGAGFQGLDFAGFGAGWPPDPNGDVGPSHYVQTVNTSVGIFDKTGARLAAFSFNTLWSQAGTGTHCDNANQGDPVALYDPFGDRFIVADFAWGNYSTGPFYECIAVSRTSDPVAGGWWFYAWQLEGGAKLPDYPKLGVWPDGIYMSANVFASTGSGSFQNAQVWAFDRQRMEAGDPNAQAVTFNLPRTVGGTTVFSLLPSNARSVTGAPPAGAPNYFASIWGLYATQVWKFHVDWSSPASSTFTGPTNTAIASVDTGPSEVPERDGNDLDTLNWRLMMQNQYTNLNGRESLWLTHTVGSGGSPNVARIRWYELPVTGGTVSSSLRQQSTWGPDSSNRFMPSLAVDRNGDMAVGYSVSDATMYPALRYSGRLAGDPLSQLTQGETTLVQGLGYQCCTFSNGAANNRWGDYSAMTIDPDGCSFWYTGEHYDAHPATLAQDNWLTRIGSFRLPGCTDVAGRPSVSGFSPGSGSPGASVTVTGSNLAGATSVTFNGVAAAFSVVSGSQLAATVPAGATSGPVTVTTPVATAASAASFTVAGAVPAPSITSLSPTSGPVGTSVTITGANLTGASAVGFNGTAATTFAVVSATTVTATVPAGAATGPVSVTTPGGTATSPGSFTVTASAPTISGFSPTSGKAGTAVTIAGTGFTGASSVKFNGKAATFTVVSSTQISTKVPAGAKTGTISVATPAGTATSAQKFTVTK
jgi:hypothetical protein